MVDLVKRDSPSNDFEKYTSSFGARLSKASRDELLLYLINMKYTLVRLFLDLARISSSFILKNVVDWKYGNPHLLYIYKIGSCILRDESLVWYLKKNSYLLYLSRFRDRYNYCAPGMGDNLVVKVHYALGSRKC